MCRLVNRIVYGESKTPKYIRTKSQWLYNNKWIPRERAYEILSGKRVGYTYSLYKGNVASFGELQTFDEVIDMVYKYPTDINFTDLNQFSMQELSIILGIQKRYAISRHDKFMQSMAKIEAELRDF